MAQTPDDPNRNPLVIPRSAAPVKAKGGCIACGHQHVDSFMSSGVVTHKCLKCGNKWYGGIGMVMQDPREPMPPLNPQDAPVIDFERTKNSAHPEEVKLKRVDPTQSYRKGMPVPGENDG
jgi:hypothetical protein